MFYILSKAKQNNHVHFCQKYVLLLVCVFQKGVIAKNELVIMAVQHY